MTQTPPSPITCEKVIVSVDHSQPRESSVEGYYQGFNEKLYAAIPKASRILELGCAGGRLGEQYKTAHPQAFWVGVDIYDKALEIASTRLDAVYCIDVDAESLDAAGAGFDCIVFGDLLEHLKYPERLLKSLHRLTSPDATLVCCVPNMTHLSVIERMLMGDLSYEQDGLLDRTHLRFFSQRSLFKMLLDCGWLPDLTDWYFVGPANEGVIAPLLQATQALRVPPATAAKQLFNYQMIVRCTKRPAMENLRGVPFSVVVPVSHHAQASLNILSSPGLKEIDTEVILVRHATSAAAALEQGAALATNPWVLFCHQDVYFPEGTGQAIASVLAEVQGSDASRTIIGFAGIALNGTEAGKAGLVIDRTALFDFPATDKAISIDELCVAIHRDAKHRIDPRLEWHLWATDLCLQSLHDSEDPRFATIVRVPLFHNSTNDGSLSDAFHQSKARLLTKYPGLVGVTTLCGTFLQREAAVTQQREAAVTQQREAAVAQQREAAITR